MMRVLEPGEMKAWFSVCSVGDDVCYWMGHLTKLPAGSRVRKAAAAIYEMRQRGLSGGTGHLLVYQRRRLDEDDGFEYRLRVLKKPSLSDVLKTFGGM